MKTQRDAEQIQNLVRGPRFNIFSLKDHAVVREAVAQLQGYEHSVILMRFWEQNTISEIADILDLSLSEVENYLNRAMLNLKAFCLTSSIFSRSVLVEPEPDQITCKAIAA